MSRSAVFVIDIQHEMAGDPSTWVPDVAELKSATNKILSTARSIIDSYRGKGQQSPLTLVFVQHEEPAGSGGLEKGSKQWELVFHPREGDSEEVLVSKTHGDTFESNPGLADKLRSQGVSQIYTFGIQSDECVQKTTRGALAAKLPVTVLSGAHATYDSDGKTAQEIQKSIDAELAAEGAKVAKWEDVVASWEAEYTK